MGMKSGDENQNIEWKWSWNDEYLKWLCGYANVKGGTLYIGVNDDGYVVGLENARLLLEQLPNKIIGKRAGIEIGSSTSKSGTEETGVSESHKKAYENMLRICSERLSYKEKNRLLPIVQYFETHEVIDSKGAQSLTGKGKTTAVGYLNRLCELEVINKDDISVSTIYKLKIE